MAREFPEPDKKLALLDMANAWLRLADITEKFDHALARATNNKAAINLLKSLQLYPRWETR